MPAKCSKCGGEIEGETCPTCGTAVKKAFGDKPKSEKLRMASSAVMIVGCILVVLEIFSKIKTYAGTLLIGGGFLLNAFFQREKVRESKTDSKKAQYMSMVLAVIIILAGILFLYLDLR